MKGLAEKQLIVVKAGGQAVSDDSARHYILDSIRQLMDQGCKVLLVYGGGHLIDQGLSSAGIKPRKKNGRRITGTREIGIVKQVMAGDLSFRIAATMAEQAIKGLCLNAIPAHWISLLFRERDNPEDYGYDATIPRVFGEYILEAFHSTDFIATPCQGVSNKGAVNINGDNAAVALAVGVKARRLVFLSDVDGVLDNGVLIPRITDKDISVMIETGAVQGGMRVKLENCLDALAGGVEHIHLLNGFRPDALLQGVRSTGGESTVLYSAN